MSVAAPQEFEVIGADQLVGEKVDWLWPGFLARGQVTHFPTPPWMGKTTLLALLLKAMENGGELLGEPVAAGRAVIVTDEPKAVWEDRHVKLKYGPNVKWIRSPFHGQPDVNGWLRLIDRLVGLAADLVVLDPLAVFLPRGHENNSVVLDSLEYLHLVTEKNASVMTIHHTPVSRTDRDDFLSRGFGGIKGFANILMKMEVPRGESPTTRLRTISTKSKTRGYETRLAELNAESTAYNLLPKPAEANSYEEGWPALRIVLEDTRDRLTVKQIHAAWPPDHDRPSMATLQRWLKDGMAAGTIVRRGKGRSYFPFVYALAGRTGFEKDIFGALNPVTMQEEFDVVDYPPQPKPAPVNKPR